MRSWRRGLAQLGIELAVVDLDVGPPEGDYFGIVQQYPGSSGALRDFAEVTDSAHERGALVTVAADLLALTVLKPPGEWGADVVVGSSQRFGVPLWYGGPHAAFMAVKAGLERDLPGRLVGLSIDAEERPAYRLVLQTREQHIRREGRPPTSARPRCLLAVVADVRGVPRPRGFASDRTSCAPPHRRDRPGPGKRWVRTRTSAYFDTIVVQAPGRASDVVKSAREGGVLLRRVDDDHVGISCGETTTVDHVVAVLRAFGAEVDGAGEGSDTLPEELRRRSPILAHPVFSQHHSETSMLRYLRELSDRDFALDRGMIPLGSCTMKLNATSEMEPVGLPGFADIHPFAPAETTPGYHALIDELEQWLADLTGYAKVSVQPNAGSQGELAGLMAIHAYHQARNEPQRDVCLIPSSAHGTERRFGRHGRYAGGGGCQQGRRDGRPR